MNFFSYLLDPTNWQGSTGLGQRLLEHLEYSLGALVVAAIIAIPIGLLIGHTGRGNIVVIGLGNAARAVPTLGLIVLIVLIFGTGLAPIFVVLIILAIPPILTATAAGVAGADREAVYAARALGMTGGQIVGRVEWPLALPLVLSGLRSASLQVIATATIAAYVTLGGLGRPIIDGIAFRQYTLSFAGAILVGLLAIVFDVLLGLAGRIAASRSGQTRRSTRLARRAAQVQVSTTTP